MFPWSPPFLPARVTRWQSVAAAFLFSRVAGSFKTVQQAREKLTSIKQGTVLTEVRSMDEERRSLAELHILKGRARK